MSVFLLFISIALLFVDKSGGKLLSKKDSKKHMVEQNSSPFLAAAKSPDEENED
jgi:hypothetical protein